MAADAAGEWHVPTLQRVYATHGARVCMSIDAGQGGKPSRLINVIKTDWG